MAKKIKNKVTRPTDEEFYEYMKQTIINEEMEKTFRIKNKKDPMLEYFIKCLEKLIQEI